MDTNNFFKNHFLGRDGFIWWIGQVAKEESWSNQAGEGWCNRVKVRIQGYHPYSVEELPDDDLPFAHIMLPPTAGTGGGQYAETAIYRQGDVVIGFFMDGTDAQQPVIMGSLGKSRYKAVDNKERLPFTVFSGFSENIKPASGAITPNEVNDNSEEAQPTNVSQSPTQAQQRGKKSFNSTDGLVDVNPECHESAIEKTVGEISTTIENFMTTIRNFKASFDEGTEFYRDLLKTEIESVTEKIKTWSSGIIGPMSAGTYEGLIPIFKSGIKMLYDTVYATVLAATGQPPIAHKAGVAAQTAMVGPVQAVEDLFKCIVGQIQDRIVDVVKGMLESIVDNAVNFVDCMVDQFVGGIMNGIIDQISGLMSGVLGGVTKILQFFGNFSVDNMLRNGIDTLLGLIGFQACSKNIKKNKGNCKYIMGVGEVSPNDVDLERILGNANVAKAASVAASVAGFPLDGVQDVVGALDMFDPNFKVPGFQSALGNCYGGVPQLCGGPKINIFGGRGSGGSAVPLLGNIIGSGSSRTGGIISVKVTDPGSDYMFPPFVQIVDECGQGYGAHAHAIIKNNKIDSIYIVSEGENYPVEEAPPLFIDNVTIVNPGTGYDDDTTITDDLGNEYVPTIISGSIVKVTPINNKEITSIPVFNIIGTGDGAQLSAVLTDDVPPQGEVKQVIDCVS